MYKKTKRSCTKLVEKFRKMFPQKIPMRGFTNPCSKSHAPSSPSGEGRCLSSARFALWTFVRNKYDN